MQWPWKESQLTGDGCPQPGSHARERGYCSSDGPGRDSGSAQPAAHCSAVEEPEDGALREPQIRVHTWGAGRDGELTKRGPAAVRLVVCWLAEGRATGFPAPATEPDLALVQGSAVPVQLALGHPQVSEARDVHSGRPCGLAAESLPRTTTFQQSEAPRRWSVCKTH